MICTGFRFPLSLRGAKRRGNLLVPLMMLTAKQNIIPGDRHEPKGPRDDTVINSQEEQTWQKSKRN